MNKFLASGIGGGFLILLVCWILFPNYIWPVKESIVMSEQKVIQEELLKYDLKYMIKNMTPFYVLAIIFAVITRILYSLEQSNMITIFANISAGCMISMVASILINVVMRSFVRFRDFIYI